MLTTLLCAKDFRDCIQSFGRMLDAIDQVVGILAFVALVEGKRLQAGKANQIGVLDLLGRDAVFTQQLSLNFGDLVQVEDDGRVRNVE